MSYLGFGRTDPFSGPVNYLPPTTYHTVPVNTPSQPVVPIFSQPVAPPPPTAALSEYSPFYRPPARPVLAPPRTQPEFFPVTAAATTHPIRTVNEIRPRTPIQGYNAFHDLTDEEQLALAIAESEYTAQLDERRRLENHGMVPGYEDDYELEEEEDDDDDDDDYDFRTSFSSSSSSGVVV